MDEADRVESIIRDWRARIASGKAPPVEEILAAHPDLAEPLRARLGAPAAFGVDGRPELRNVPVDRYRDFRLLGHGGMGIVYWALDTDLNRQVAFKVVRPDGGGTSAPAPCHPITVKPPEPVTPASQAFATLKARFLQEAWVTAGLEHPGIIPVYEVGRTPEGVPYYTMRFVRGSRTMAREIAEARAKPMDARLALLEPFLKVCDTVRYAHAHGVVHRDLKPENIALGEFGEVVVLDWGIAKIEGRPEAGAAAWQARVDELRRSANLETLAGAMGTPGYMAPEAALGLPQEVDARSDVYSLGAILHEILTGRLPHEFRTYGDLLLRLLDDPSPDPSAIDAAVPAEIAQICRRSLAKERDRRTPTAESLATEIRAWIARREQDRELDALREQAKAALASAGDLSGDARLHQLDRAASACDRVLGKRADDPGAEEIRGEIDALRARGVAERDRFVRRRALRRAGVVALLFLVVAGVAIGKILDDRRREAEDANARAKTALSGERREREEKERALVRTRAVGLAHASAAAQSVDGMRAALLAREAARILMLPGVRTQLHAALSRSPERARLMGHGGAVRDVAWFPSGEYVVSGSDDAMARIWTPAGRPLAVLRGHAGPVVSVAVSPRGDIVASASEDGSARLWSITGDPVGALSGHSKAVRRVRFSPEGSTVVTASDDGTARLWGRDGRPRAALTGHSGPVTDVVFSPAGDVLATSSADGTARVWSLEGGELAVLRGHEKGVASVAFSPDGSRLATASSDRTARLFGRDGRPLAVLRGHPGIVLGATFSPDGARLLTWDTAQTARLWDREGRALEVLGPEPDEIHHGEFSPCGDLVVLTASWGGTARVRSLDGREVALLRMRANYLAKSVFSPDGRRIATAVRDGTVRIWTPDPAELTLFRGHTEPVNYVEFARRGERLISSSVDGTVRVWDRHGRPLHVIGATGAVVESISVAPDGERFATSATDGTVRIMSLDGVELGAFRAHDGATRLVTWSPREDRLLTHRYGETVRLFDLDGRRHLEMTFPRASAVTFSTFSPDGQRILTGHVDGTARIHDLSGKELEVLRGHRLRVWSVAMSPDMRRVVTCCEDSSVLLHDLVTKASIRLEGFEHSCGYAQFPGDGRFVAAASWDGTIRAWDMDGRERFVIRPGDLGVSGLDFDPSGRTAVTGMGDSLRTWLVEDDDLLALAEERCLRDFSPDELDSYADLLASRDDERLRVSEVVRNALALEWFPADAAERIAADGTIPPEIRSAAVEVLRGRREEPGELAAAAFEVAARPVAPPEEHQRALRRARRAAAIDAGTAKVRWALAAALYRCGEFEESVRTLDRGPEGRMGSGHEPSPAEAAILALALLGLGRTGDARAQLARLHEMREQAPAGRDAVADRLIAEAEAQIGSDGGSLEK